MYLLLDTFSTLCYYNLIVVVEKFCLFTIINFILFLIAEMKKAQVMVPPRPKMRSHHERYNPVILQSFYGILYRFDQNNKWENVEKDYIKINFLDFELSEHPYRLEAISGNEVRYFSHILDRITSLNLISQEKVYPYISPPSSSMSLSSFHHHHHHYF